MALKPDRNVLETDISLVCNDVVEKGTIRSEEHTSELQSH